MDVIGFLCVSLTIRTDQLHESLGSRRGCSCSAADFNSLNGAVLEVCYRKAVFCCAILWAKGPNAKDIHKEIFPVYGGKCLLRKAVHNWVEKFSQGRSKVADDAQPGCPVEIAIEVTAQRLEQLSRADRRLTTDSVATALGYSHGLAYSTMHGHLKFRKVCARWVPKELKNRQKRNLMGLSLLLLRYTDEGRGCA
jgi:hypothetical protein